MNKTILADKIFAIYTKLPHCLILRSRHMKDVRRRFDRDKLKDISVISANCVGGEICFLLGIGFRSPFVNISMDRAAFIRMVSRLKEYMELPLEVHVNETESCTGSLQGPDLPAIEIRFPHDADPAKVAENWERRKKRINYDKLVLIVDDKGLKEADYRLYDQLPAFRKICLTAADLSDRYAWAYQMKEYAGAEKTGEYNAKSKDGLWVFTKTWDYTSWLNGN